MRRISITLSIVLSSLLLSALPVRSDEQTMSEGGQPEQMQQKDECLLLARNCRNDVDSIQQRLERLNREISKGRGVYTPEEMQILKDKLNDTYREMDDWYNTN